MTGGAGGDDGAPDWREVVGCGVVAGDLSVGGLVRYAAVTPEVAARALREASDTGVLDGGVVDEAAAAALVGHLGPDRVARVHADAALHLLRAGPEHFRAALDHARAASVLDQPDLVRLTRSSGRLALAAGDHATAELLLRAAVDLDRDVDPDELPRDLLDLARALDGRGRVREAHELLEDVLRMADAAGDHGLVVDAAVRSAFPPDWRAGDRRTAALLDRAERVEGGGARAAAILAARAMVEMRIPASPDPGAQIAWITRATVAQPLAERALELTDGTATPDRLVALAAWRSTHRGPALLARRLVVSEDAVDLAQRLLDHDRLVESGVALAVDHLEAGDRTAYDRALTTVRWAAETDGNPRLRWWAATTAVGTALLDGDLDGAAEFRARAARIGEEHELPGWIAAELLFAAEMALAGSGDDLASFLVPDDTPVLASPIARASVAWIAGRLGERELALAHARVAFRALDTESSYLLVLTLLAHAAVAVADVDLGAAVADHLEPWRGHTAVDASGWWCAGPVDLALAELAADAGRLDEATTLLGAAEPTVDSLGDVRSRSRLVRCREVLAAGAPARAGAETGGLALLSERERAVLALIAAGHTNAAIGEALSYSPSTIRADTVSIYRKLGVKRRAEAAALAVSAGLAGPGH